MAIDVEADSRRVDEFVCTSCFLLRKNVQLADPKKYALRRLHLRQGAGGGAGRGYPRPEDG